MHNFGHTRSCHERDHFLSTPDTFVRAPLPGMTKAMAIVHASPANGAGFAQYTVEFEAGGEIQLGPHQSFLYVLDGSVTIDKRQLWRGQYAYRPGGDFAKVTSGEGSRAVVIEKPHCPLLGSEPPYEFWGDENKATPKSLGGDEALEVRTLVPEDVSFDFAVNTMTYQPGATLPMVEVHVMEHGMLMLEGGGIYRLNERWYPVTAGDFIWMGPYCPQWFGALGKQPAKYLIYKDWNRHPLEPK